MLTDGPLHPTPLSEKLSYRTRNSLARNGITNMEQLVAAYPAHLLKLHGIGMTALREIEKVILSSQPYTPIRKNRGGQPRRPPYLLSEELYFDKPPPDHNPEEP